MIKTRGFDLYDWQKAAVDAWVSGDEGGPYRGTLEIFTGGGKTLIAMACLARAAQVSPDLRLAVVVPSAALAHQWIEVLTQRTNLERAEIGLLGAGGKTTLQGSRAVVAVINSASRHLPEMARIAQPLMLIVDECHRAGAPTFARVLSTQAPYRLGLSATPEREEVDEYGEPLPYDEQLVGRRLGSVVYSFSLRDARHHGWLPDYEIHHHGVQLSITERRDYEMLSRKVDDAANDLRALGHETNRAQHLQGRTDEVGRAATSYVALTSQRKDLLYRCRERNRVATKIVTTAMSEKPLRRALLFHERVDSAVKLATQLAAAQPVPVALEHSQLSDSVRKEALDSFRSGRIPVLVSVRSLIEGIDVPEADLGISVASSSSIRQRIQSLGRVLRRQFDADGGPKESQMHLIYVTDSVDEVIYTKLDWSDLTGPRSNRYWLWSADPDLAPIPQDGPPGTPLPTESQEWSRLGSTAPTEPVPWLGPIMGQEYSVNTLGTVTNAFGTVIANPQGVAELVSGVRGRNGGRFHITPEHRLVLVVAGGGDEARVLVAGRLDEPFRSLPDVDTEQAASIDVSKLAPGDTYLGPTDKAGGVYKLRQKQGGVIERRTKDHGSEFALTSGSGSPRLDTNAQNVLHAWRELFDRGISFSVNERGDAWFTDGGQRRFLAHVPGGFAWPSETSIEERFGA